MRSTLFGYAAWLPVTNITYFTTFYTQMSVRNCFIRGSVVRYVQVRFPLDQDDYVVGFETTLPFACYTAASELRGCGDLA